MSDFMEALERAGRIITGWNRRRMRRVPKFVLPPYGGTYTVKTVTESERMRDYRRVQAQLEAITGGLTKLFPVEYDAQGNIVRVSTEPELFTSARDAVEFLDGKDVNEQQINAYHMIDENYNYVRPTDTKFYSTENPTVAALYENDEDAINDITDRGYPVENFDMNPLKGGKPNKSTGALITNSLLYQAQLGEGGIFVQPDGVDEIYKFFAQAHNEPSDRAREFIIPAATQGGLRPAYIWRGPKTSADSLAAIEELAIMYDVDSGIADLVNNGKLHIGEETQQHLENPETMRQIAGPRAMVGREVPPSISAEGGGHANTATQRGRIESLNRLISSAKRNLEMREELYIDQQLQQGEEGEEVEGEDTEEEEETDTEEEEETDAEEEASEEEEKEESDDDGGYGGLF